MQLECRALTKQYHTRQGAVVALDQIHFCADQGEFVCLVGPSGCGKSTLLRIIAGLVMPSSGSFQFRGVAQAPTCAMVFQDAGLLPWLSVIDNVALGLEAQGMSLALRHARAQEQLARMGLADFAHHLPHELSGGMRQRVAIARAFVVEPDVLLMDEPFRALDAQTRMVLQEEVLRLHETRPRLVLFVTHDIDEAIRLGDRVLVMSGRPGRIQADLAIPLSHPRDLTGRPHPEAEELRWQIWKMLEREVRSNLKITAAHPP